MWKRLSNHLRMNDCGGRRDPSPELTMVLLDFAARRRRLEDVNRRRGIADFRAEVEVMAGGEHRGLVFPD